MRRYEILLILKPEIGDEGFQEKMKSIKEHLEAEGSAFVKEDIWGLRQLAYPIKKNKKGYYAFLVFDIMPDKISTIKKEFEIEDDLLRSIIKLFKERKGIEPESAKADEKASNDEKGTDDNMDEGDGSAKEVNKTDYGESE